MDRFKVIYVQENPSHFGHWPYIHCICVFQTRLQLSVLKYYIFDNKKIYFGLLKEKTLLQLEILLKKFYNVYKEQKLLSNINFTMETFQKKMEYSRNPSF